MLNQRSDYEYDEIISLVREKNLGQIYNDYSLKELCSIRCGGRCKYYFEPNSIKSMLYFLEKVSLPYYIFGNGTNVLPSSKDYKGVIITLKRTNKWYLIKEDKLFISSSFSLKKIAGILANKKYENLEFFSTIPGTVGGAIMMNAGCFNKETSMFIEEIIVYDGKVKKYKKNELEFAYRKSNIKGIILSAVFKIKKTEKNTMEIINYQQEIRKRTQPIDEACFGSVFKNPLNYKAWELIESINMRGYNINGAMVSKKHANFIVNDGASGEDILELIMLITYKIYKKYGLFLENEVILFNF